MLKIENCIQIQSGRICIPACGSSWANMLVILDRARRSEGFHTVDSQSLVSIDYRRVHYTEMHIDEYNRILQENRDAVLQKVKELNRRICRVGKTLYIDGIGPNGESLEMKKNVLRR